MWVGPTGIKGDITEDFLKHVEAKAMLDSEVFAGIDKEKNIRANLEHYAQLRLKERPLELQTLWLFGISSDRCFAIESPLIYIEKELASQIAICASRTPGASPFLPLRSKRFLIEMQ